MNMPGWIALNRSLTSWEWYDDANTMRLFVHFLLKANYEPKKWKGISIDRGEFVTSNEALAVELKLSVQQVRTSLKKLKSTNEVTCKTTNKMSLISITNYKKFQDINIEITSNQHRDNTEITSNQHRDNIEITSKSPPNQHRDNIEITSKSSPNQHRDNNNITNKQINNKQNINTSCADSENSAPKQKTKKTPKKTSKAADLDFSTWPEKPSPEIWAQYKKIRAAKRAPVTQVLVDAMGEEFAKLDPLDWSVEKALRIAIASGWQGFKAQWLVNKLGFHERPAAGRFPRDGPLLTRDMSLEDELSDTSWASS